MNKTTQEYIKFTERVTEQYWKMSKSEEDLPLTTLSAGYYGNAIIIDIEGNICSDNGENIEEGIKSIDIFIKKLKFLKKAIVKEYCKLSDEQLEYFGVYKE